MVTRPHEPFLSTVIAVLSIAVAVVLAVGTGIAQWYGTAMFFAPYMLAMIVGAVVALIARHVQLYKSLEPLSHLLTVNRLAARMYELSAKGDSHATRCGEIIDFIERIEDSWSAVPGGEGIKQWKYGSILQELRRVANGHIVIDDANKEITTNEDFMEQLCKDNMHAVSYKDEPFWQAPEGKAFLEKQKHLILTRRIRITRIFIISTSVTDLTPVLRAHQGAGIHVRYIPENDLEPHDRVDFVLYDNGAVRIGDSFIDPNHERAFGKFKHASLMIAPDAVQDWRNRFEALRRRSIEFKS